MNTNNKTDCVVVFLGNSYDGYRVVNQTLRALGICVIWSTGAQAARFLLDTRQADMILCNAAGLPTDQRALLDQLNRGPGPCRGLALTLPVRSSNPDDLEKNIHAYKRLLRGVTSMLIGTQQQQEVETPTAAAPDAACSA